MNHATLSSMLSGKRKITRKAAAKIGSRLGLSPEEMGKLSAENRSTPYFALQQDAFSAISEWHYDAILELSRISSRLNPELVADALGIPALTARLSLEALVRLDLLELKNGRYRLIHENSTNILDPDLTSAAQRKYQKSILKKSEEALEAVARVNRDHTSMTMAIRRADVPKAKELLKKFRQEFTALMQAGGKPDEVYQLQLAFFPLTRTEREDS